MTVVVNSQSVAGGPSESAVHPRWLGDKLIFVSDRTNWWNLYLWSEDGVRPLCTTEAEFCGPQWVLGQRPYAIIDHDHLLCSINRSGEQSIAVLGIPTASFITQLLRVRPLPRLLSAGVAPPPCSTTPTDRQPSRSSISITPTGPQSDPPLR